MKKTLDYKKRCADCVCLAEEDGQWYCDEAQEFCKNIEDGDCPEGE